MKRDADEHTQRNWGNEPVLDRLRALLAEDPPRAVGFVGAGASAGIYPVWQQLVYSMAQETAECGLANQETVDYWLRISTRNPAQAARWIRHRMGPQAYNRYLRRTFGPPADPPAYTPLHRALMLVPFKGYVTTNYDNGLAAARAEIHSIDQDLGDAAWSDAPCLLQRWVDGTVFRRGGLPILFMHGRFDAPENIVLGAGKYREAYNVPIYRDLLNALWQRESLVFAGFGFSDPWFDFAAEEIIMQAADEAEQRHFAFVGLRDDHSYCPDMRLMFLEQYNCDVIFYPVTLRRDGQALVEDHTELLATLTPFMRAPMSETTPPWPIRRKVEHGDVVRPLYVAESRYLQLLLSSFDLARVNGGAQLSVQFDSKTEAIWSDAAKQFLLRTTPDFEEKAQRYQSELDAFLLHGEGDKYSFRDSSFSFRYVSGGTLPILVTDLGEYYCLFYRTSYPVGWNIANGGSDSFEELWHPETIIARELLEELILIGAESDIRLPVEPEIVRPEPELARERWNPILKEKFLRGFDSRATVNAPTHLIEGSDQLTVQYGTDVEYKLDGIFLNINALDFGIEVDRVLRIDLTGQFGEDFLMLDGELTTKVGLLDRPVGLFRVERLHDELDAGAHEFLPDSFYHAAERRRGNFRQYVADTLASPPRTPDDSWPYQTPAGRFGLCPVTERIIRRYAGLRATGGPVP